MVRQSPSIRPFLRQTHIMSMNDVRLHLLSMESFSSLCVHIWSDLPLRQRGIGHISLQTKIVLACLYNPFHCTLNVASGLMRLSSPLSISVVLSVGLLTVVGLLQACLFFSEIELLAEIPRPIFFFSYVFSYWSLFQQDCPSGRLTPAKFVDMYKMFFPNGNAEEFCDHVFRTFDRDKNGFIDFKVSLI